MGVLLVYKRLTNKTKLSEASIKNEFSKITKLVLDKHSKTIIIKKSRAIKNLPIYTKLGQASLSA